MIIASARKRANLTRERAQTPIMERYTLVIADSMRSRSSGQPSAHRIADQGEMVVERSSTATICP
jgi:hypothetical protein